MNDKTYYNNYFAKKYNLKNVVWRSFLFLIGAGENPYQQYAEKIANKTVREAFEEDMIQLSIDFKNAMEKHKHELPFPYKENKSDYEQEGQTIGSKTS